MPTPLAPEVREAVEASIEHYNARHADTVLLLARYAAQCTDATDAEAIAVDTEGIDLSVRVGGIARPARIAFDTPLSTALDVHGQVAAKIAAARATAGDAMPITSMERETAASGSLRTFDAEVVSFRDLSPNLREIVITGELDGFEPLGDDQFVYVFVGRTADQQVTPGYTMAQWMADDHDTRPFGAYYTIRAWDPATRHITMWFVRHGHDGGVGGWAGRCRVGERIAIWGPRESFRTPPDTRWHLFVADESGFAAVAVRIEELPDEAEVIAILETVDEDHIVPITDRDGVEVRWLFRGADEPGVGTRLLDEVCSIDVTRRGLTAFGAAESRQVSAIRRFLRRDHAIAGSHVSMTGYWRR